MVQVIEFEQVNFDTFRSLSGENLARLRREEVGVDEFWDSLETGNHYRMFSEFPLFSGEMTSKVSVCRVQNDSCLCFILNDRN